METLTLLHTSDCHLCELAAEQLQLLAYPVVTSDIADDPALINRYGTRIPVLRKQSDGSELDWPFDQNAIVDFVQGPR